MGWQWIPSTKKKKEFSKVVVGRLTVLWFMGALFGGWMTYKDPSNLSTLLEYIGTPMITCVFGYLAKAAFENREKIISARTEHETGDYDGQDQLEAETFEP